MSATAMMPPVSKATPAPAPEPVRQRPACAKDGDDVYWRASPDDVNGQALAKVIDAGPYSATIMLYANGKVNPKPWYVFNCYRADYIKDNPSKDFSRTTGCFVPYYSVHGANERMESQDAKIDRIELAFKALASQIAPLLGLKLKGKDLADLVAKSEEKPS
jgi:hypothetical protein